ncbi:MAG: glycosyltransferase family 87 protein [Bacteroidales bacterium]
MRYDFQFLLKKRTAVGLWILAGLCVVIIQYLLGTNGKINNFIIFKTSFSHLANLKDLYIAYPGEYSDLYLYGPLFALFMAPFALLPVLFSYTLWIILNATVLLYAIYQLPVSDKNRAIVSWIVFNCLITSLLNSQVHAMTAALIILSYTHIRKKQFFWAAFFLVMGVFIKLYGILGLAFFFFVEDKPKYLLYLVFWTVVLFILPMAFVGIDYTIQCYGDWYRVLVHKNSLNVMLENSRTDVCVMGMFRRLFHDSTLSNLYFIIPGLLIFALSYIRKSQFGNVVFQLRILASALLFVILASTGSESPTIIIGFAGVAIWFILSEKTKLDIALLLFALIISSFSPTDVFPEYIRDRYINQYALIVLPLLLVWLKLNWDIAGGTCKNDPEGPLTSVGDQVPSVF